MPQLRLGPGDRLGDLVIEREIGEGAFAVVYVARDTLLERRVALKVIGPSALTRSGDQRDRMLQEARLVARLQSPHIVTLHRVHDLRDSGLALEMELMEGGSLESLLGTRGALASSEVETHALSVFRGLAAAHAERIVHGDLKPENLLFSASATLKLADFGLGRDATAASLSAQQGALVCGTPLYMAPEVVAGERATAASDLWSAGVILYRMLAGRLPFEPRNLPALFYAIFNEAPASLASERPPHLVALVERCLAKEPGSRPSSANEAIALLGSGLRPGAVPRPAGASASAPRSRPDHPSPLGRDPERIVLEEAVQAADRGDGGAVLVWGEAGMGKTTLLRALEASAVASGVAWLNTAMSPLGGLPHALLAAAREALWVEGQESTAYLDEGRFGAAAPVLRELLGGEARGRGGGRQQLVWALEHLLRGLSATRSLVVAIEDVHFADVEDLTALTELVRRTSNARILFIATFRTRDLHSSDGMRPIHAALSNLIAAPGVRSLHLGPVDDDVIRRVVARDAGVSRVSAEVGERISSQASGNPLFAVELMRYLLEEGRAVRQSAEVVAGPRWGQQELPTRLRELIVARLAAVSPEDRALLDAAAADGVTFDPAAVAAAVEQGLLKVLRDLQRIHREHGVVAPDRHGFRFSHPLFREVVHLELSGAYRRELHRSIARTLEARGHDTAKDAERLGSHWEEAGDLARAQPYLARAAALAAERQQWRRTVDLCGRAGLEPATLSWELAERHAPLLLEAVYSYSEVGRPLDAVRILDRLAEAASRSEASPLIHQVDVERAFLTHYAKGPVHVDVAALHRAVAALPPSKALGRAHYVLGVGAKERGDLRQARHHLTEAERVWSELGMKGPQGSALDQLGSTAWRAGDLAGASSAYGRAIEASTSAGRRLDAAISRVNKCAVDAEAGGAEDVAHALEEAVETFRLAGSTALTGHAQLLLARERFERGSVREAREVIEPILAAPGSVPRLAFLEGQLLDAEVDVAADDLDRATQKLEDVRARCLETQNTELALRALGLAETVARLRFDPRRARDLELQSEALVAGAPPRAVREYTACIAVGLVWRPDRARAAGVHRLATSPACADGAQRAFARALAGGVVARCDGDVPGALGAARSLAETVGFRWRLAARCCHALFLAATEPPGAERTTLEEVEECIRLARAGGHVQWAACVARAVHRSDLEG